MRNRDHWKPKPGSQAEFFAAGIRAYEQKAPLPTRLWLRGERGLWTYRGYASRRDAILRQAGREQRDFEDRRRGAATAAEGGAAWRRGIPIDGCSIWPRGTWEWRAWRRGWREERAAYPAEPAAEEGRAGR